MTVPDHDHRLVTTAFGASAADPDPAPPSPRWYHTFLLQTGHRAASISLLLVSVNIVAILAEKTDNAAILPIIAFGLADLALVVGVVAWWIGSRKRLRRWEAIGIMLFSLLLVLTAGYLALCYQYQWWPIVTPESSVV